MLHRCAELGRMHVHRGAVPLPRPAAVLMADRDRPRPPSADGARARSSPGRSAEERAAGGRRPAAASAALGRPVAGRRDRSTSRALTGIVALRAERAGADGRPRHAAGRDRGAARRERPDAGVRAARTTARCSARRRRARTIGGVFACNLAGPRRIKAGAARDHLLGFAAVAGRGEVFKAGGRVVKNVTGYDLCKLMAGSYGTLAVMTEVTLKVLPVAEAACTVLLLGLDEEPRGRGRRHLRQ